MYHIGVVLDDIALILNYLTLAVIVSILSLHSYSMINKTSLYYKAKQTSPSDQFYTKMRGTLLLVSGVFVVLNIFSFIAAFSSNDLLSIAFGFGYGIFVSGRFHIVRLTVIFIPILFGFYYTMQLLYIRKLGQIRQKNTILAN